MSRSSEFTWTDTNYCPYCGHDEFKDKEKDWEQRDYSNEAEQGKIAFRFHGVSVCKDCGGRFETVSELQTGNIRESKQTYTLQFVPENTDDPNVDITDMQGVKIVAGGENNKHVEAERAKWNMLFGGCGEVQGPKYAIEDLYDFIMENADISADEETFQAGRLVSDFED